jgi:redox-sensitive bicupin YhaK (pirin superfamily)
MHGFQLWANLPRADKMMAPRYRGISAAEIPTVVLRGGATAKVIAGVVNGVTGPVRDVVTRPEYLDVSVPAGVTFVHDTPRGHTVFAYVTGGEGWFDEGRERMLDDRQLVGYGEGDRVAITAGAAGVQFLLVSGQPIGEPIAWRGPIVMNSEDELATAFDELERGNFIKKE